VAFINSSSITWDTDSKPQLEITVDEKVKLNEADEAPSLWDDDEDYGNTLITFSANDITAQEALDIVTDITNTKYIINDEGKVIILPRSAACGEIETQIFSVDPAVIKRLMELSDSSAPQAELPETVDLTPFFAETGVSWPSEASIKYDKKLGKLIAANTRDNLDILKKVLKAMQPPQPRVKAYGVNPFVNALQQPFSTFSIDVDTAAYTLGRNYLLRGELPPAESVRTEEYVNFFDYGYKAPLHKTFAVYTEIAPSRFGHGLQLLKIGVKGRRLGREEQRRAVLTFLIDASGSMNRSDRMGLVKKSLKMLVNELAPNDLVAIVLYDSHARLILEHTPAAKKAIIMKAIDRMQCGGSTNLEEGMQRAYQLAAANFAPKGENRVLLLSDGVANLGSGSAEDILKSIEKYRRQGITCSVFGFGMGSYDDTMLETLANKGDGTYAFVDSKLEAKRIFVDELSATLNTIASDVKIQVEYNPAYVAQYRQIGYENRKLKKEDFRNDSVDAGEIGSGQAVTALYELQLNSAPPPTDGINNDVIATVRVRYRRIDTGKVEEIEHRVRRRDLLPSFDRAAPRFKLAACVAEFAEILRGSPFANGSKPQNVAETLRPVALELNLNRNVNELLQLIESAKR